MATLGCDGPAVELVEEDELRLQPVKTVPDAKRKIRVSRMGLFCGSAGKFDVRLLAGRSFHHLDDGVGEFLRAGGSAYVFGELVFTMTVNALQSILYFQCRLALTHMLEHQDR